MAGTLLGSGKYTYEPAEGWGKLPDGWRYVEVAGVDVDSKDNVYLITRGVNIRSSSSIVREIS
jgi:hypothetical protein